MRKWVLIVVLVALFIIAMKLLLEDVLGMNLEPAITAWLAQPGPFAASVIVGLLVIDIVVPIPSSLVMVLSGAAFGTLRGAALALAGSLGCSILGFELTRRYGRRVSARLVGEDELRRLEGAFARNGAGMVFVTRALPVMTETISLVAGLSKMKRSTFLVATLAGTIPQVLVYAYAGAQSRQTGSLVPAVVILIALFGGGWILWNSRKGI